MQVAQELLIGLERRNVGCIELASDQQLSDKPRKKHTGLENGLLGKCLNKSRLVGSGVDEAVVQDLDVGVLSGQHGDLVGDGLSISKGRNTLADTAEGELDVLGVCSGELRAALLANNDHVERRQLLVLPADESAQTRVNTTAKALVGRANNDERLLLAFGFGRLSSLEDLVGGLAVAAGVRHGASSTGEFGRSDNLHRVGDLLNVADGLQTGLNVSQGSVGGRGSGGGNSRASKLVSDHSKYTNKFHCQLKKIRLSFA